MVSKKVGTPPYNQLIRDLFLELRDAQGCKMKLGCSCMSKKEAYPMKLFIGFRTIRITTPRGITFPRDIAVFETSDRKKSESG